MTNDPSKIVELARRGKFLEASFLYDGSFASYAQDANFLKFGVKLYFELAHRERCLDLLANLSRLSSIEPEVALFVMQSYEQLNATAELILAAEKFARIFPNSIHIQSEYARILQTTGDFEESSRVFERILNQFGDDAQIFRMHMISVHGSDLKYSVIKGMEKLWKKTNLSITDRINLGFALGKIFDDRGDYQKAGNFFKIANDAQANQFPYDFDERVSEAKMLLEAQKGAQILKTSPPAEFTPVFITGIPRSGTTVIESKLSQSGGFESVGESSTALRATYKFFSRGSELISIKDADSEASNAFRRYCFDQLRLKVSKRSPIILDKSMRSFLVTGYIVSTLPNSRVFFIDRNPMDIAQSLYRNFFQLGSHRYSNRIEDIAKEIAIYDVVTHRFFQSLNESISRVHYERFVGDPSSTINEMKNFIGINAKNEIIDVSNERLAIKTLSVFQARQPLHTGRIAAWTKYQDIFQDFPDIYEAARSSVDLRL